MNREPYKGRVCVTVITEQARRSRQQTRLLQAVAVHVARGAGAKARGDQWVRIAGLVFEADPVMGVRSEG